MVQADELEKSADGWVLDRSPGLVIPATFAETVRRRLGAAPGTRDLLVAAALLGRSFDWRLLADMSGQDEVAVVDRLHRAVDAQLLSVEAADPGHSFRFRHALTRDAILAELLPPERATLAARGLRAVEAAHPGIPGEWCELAAELADTPRNRSGRPRCTWSQGGGHSSRRAGHLEANLERADGWPATTGTGCRDRRGALRVLVKAATPSGWASRPAPAFSAGRPAAPRHAGPGAPVAGSRGHRVGRLGTCPRSASPRPRARGKRCVEAGEFEVLAAQVALGEGRLDDAGALAERALPRPSPAGATSWRARPSRSWPTERLRDLTSAARAFSAALALAEQHGLTLWRVQALHELGTIDLLGGGPLDRLTQARRAALDAGALATAATVSLQMAAWYTNHADPEGALDAGRSCARRRGGCAPLVEGLGFAFKRWVTPCWISGPRWRWPSTRPSPSRAATPRSEGWLCSWPGRCCGSSGRTAPGHWASWTPAWSYCGVGRSPRRVGACGPSSTRWMPAMVRRRWPRWKRRG